MMKDLERYLGEIYSGSCQPNIMTNNLATFPNLEIPTIIPETGTERTNMDREMKYLRNNNIDKDFHKKLKKNNMYETDMH